MDTPIPGDMKKDPYDVALNTYRSLRGGMVVMVVMLGIAVVHEGFTATCWQMSISAYYYTTAHSIFVAALCAIGALLIVYEGSTDTEDALLNLAGVMAFVVAMVPTSRPATELMCGIYVLPEYDVTHFITNNVRSVAIPFIAVQIFYWVVVKRRILPRETSRFGIVALVVFWAVIAVGLIGLIGFRKRFDSLAHYAAATTMFLAIIATVAITAFLVKHQEKSKSKNRRRYYVLYSAIAAAMIGTLSAVVALHWVFDVWNHWIIDIETLLIVEFAVYWAIQTFELRNTPNRYELLSEKDKAILAKGRALKPSKTIAAPPEMTTRSPAAERVLRAL